MTSDRRSVLYFLGTLLLGASVGASAFFFALDKYVAVIPIAVPVEVPCQNPVPQIKPPHSRTLSTM